VAAGGCEGAHKIVMFTARLDPLSNEAVVPNGALCLRYLRAGQCTGLATRQGGVRHLVLPDRGLSFGHDLEKDTTMSC